MKISSFIFLKQIRTILMLPKPALIFYAEEISFYTQNSIINCAGFLLYIKDDFFYILSIKDDVYKYV